MANNKEGIPTLSISGVIPEGKTEIPAKLIINKLGSSVIINIQASINLKKGVVQK